VSCGQSELVEIPYGLHGCFWPMVLQKSQNALRLTAFEREAYDRSDNSGKRLVNDPTADRSADGTTIIWKIEAPHPNWIYKMSWEW
jgi:hypothetical protein